MRERDADSGRAIMTKSIPAENATSDPAEDSALDGAALDPKVLETIGRALKAHYDDLIHAPLPGKFLDLLARLEEEEEREQPRGKPDASG
jgi:Anti-sigma factor NepR